jgi:hypothetical protein
VHQLIDGHGDWCGSVGLTLLTAALAAEQVVVLTLATPALVGLTMQLGGATCGLLTRDAHGTASSPLQAQAVFCGRGWSTPPSIHSKSHFPSM